MCWTRRNYGVRRSGTHTVAKTVFCNASDAAKVQRQTLTLAPDIMHKGLRMLQWASDVSDG